MEYIIPGIIILIIFLTLITDQGPTSQEIQRAQARQVQKQQDSGCGNQIILGIIIITLAIIAASGSTTLANM